MKDSSVETSALVGYTSVSSTDARVLDLLNDSFAENSWRALRSDIARFIHWGGSVPAQSNEIAKYLAEHSSTHAVSTLRRWISSISHVHAVQDLPNPCRAKIVDLVLRGIRRRYKRPLRQASAISEHVIEAIGRAPAKTNRDRRDKAIVLLGYAGGFRRSELCAIDCTSVIWTEHGASIWLESGKTDQRGLGRVIQISSDPGHSCPVQALRSWFDELPNASGPVFRPIRKNDRILTDRLSGQSMNVIIKAALRRAGQVNSTSSHGLRAGFITNSARAGLSLWQIRQITGHSSDAMVQRYIRPENLQSTANSVRESAS